MRTAMRVWGAATALAVMGLAAPVQGQTTGSAGESPLVVIDGVVLRTAAGVEMKSLLSILEPAIESVEVLKGAGALQRYGEAGKAGVVLITLKSDYAAAQGATARGRGAAAGTGEVTLAEAAPLFIVDGVIASSVGAAGLDPKDIQSIEVIKGSAASALYGERARAGVISITTKK